MHVVKHRIALLLLLVCTVATMAQDEYEIKVYPCQVTTGTMRVDGRLDEAAWAEAPMVGGFTHYNGPERVDPQTFVRMVSSKTHLYFGVICDEPLMKQLVPVAQARDEHAVFSGETVEFFVDPKHSHADYFQFAVNAAASMYDSRKTEPAWNARVTAATALADEHWTIEFAIPWQDLGIEPGADVVVGINICRDRQIGAAKQWSNWSRTRANFHDPQRFGHVVLNPSPTGMGRLGAEFRKGQRSGPIAIYGQAGFAQTTYRSMAKNAVADLDVRLAALGSASDRELSAAARQELSRLVAAYRERTAPVRAAVAKSEALDAREWTRMDMEISRIARELDEAVWTAKLAALLSGL